MKSPRISICTAAMLLAAGSALTGCGAPPVELDPTPQPSLVSSGDYRFTDLTLDSPGNGYDLDGDSSPDNNFPYLLDQLYVDLETAVLTALQGQSTGISPEQAWVLMSGLLIEAGFPISADAWNQAESDAVRSTGVNFLPYLSSSGGRVSIVVYSGVATPYGYQRNTGAIGELTGAGTPLVNVSDGNLLLLYPQSWFNLDLLETHARFSWSGAGLTDGQLAGGIPLNAVIDAALAQVPDSIEINGQTIDIPEEAIARQLEALLLASTVTGTGEPLFDLELEDGQPAISAALRFDATRVQIASGG
jgi:hypothetical protein